jgi:glycosyltransferase involved in cell wall biosynthesis
MLRSERGFEHALVIVGRNGWLCESIPELDDELLKSAIILTGYVPDDDLVALYNMASLLVFPSIYEGFGFPCVEAMACGCPLITSNRGALREVGGDSAIYVDPDSPESIADAIWKIARSQPLRDQLINRGLQRAGRFSWDHHAKQFLSVIEQVVF